MKTVDREKLWEEYQKKKGDILPFVFWIATAGDQAGEECMVVIFCRQMFYRRAI